MTRSSSSLTHGSSISSANAAPQRCSQSGACPAHLLPRCELCREATARIYCAADEAQLCLDCDERIHSANFLVARHPRTLLCPSCGAFLRHGAPTSLEQLICYACCGGWLDSDEESKVEDNLYHSYPGNVEDNIDDDDNQGEAHSSLPEPRSGSGKHSAMRPWAACNAQVHGEEGMGDSQEGDYDV